MSKRSIPRKPNYCISDDDDDFDFTPKRSKSSSQSSQDTKFEKVKAKKKKRKHIADKELHRDVEKTLNISTQRTTKKKINVINSDSESDFAGSEHKENVKTKYEATKCKDGKSSENELDSQEHYQPSEGQSQEFVTNSSKIDEEDDDVSSEHSKSDSDYSEESDRPTKAKHQIYNNPVKKTKDFSVPRLLNTDTNSVNIKNKPSMQTELKVQDTIVSKNLADPKTTNQSTVHISHDVSQPITCKPSLAASQTKHTVMRKTVPKYKVNSPTTVNIPALMNSGSNTQSPLNIKIGLSKRGQFKPLHTRVKSKQL